MEIAHLLRHIIKADVEGSMALDEVGAVVDEADAVLLGVLGLPGNEGLEEFDAAIGEGEVSLLGSPAPRPFFFLVMSQLWISNDTHK